MSNVTELISQLGETSKNLCKAAETIKPSDVTKDNTSTLDDIIIKLQGLAADLGGSSTAAVQGFDEVLSGSVAKFVELSKKIGSEVETMGNLVKEAFQQQRAFIAMTVESKQPSDAQLPQLLAPTAEKIQAIQTLRERADRKSSFFNHLSAVSEAIGALGWVTVRPKPVNFVKEMGDSGVFYSNRVLKDFKGKDAVHAEWTKAFKGIFTHLEEYIKQYHVTGVTWNKQGKDAVLPSGGASSGGAPPPAGGAPPPPPPPPVQEVTSTAPSGGDDSRSALFAALNKGEGVTTGLKKVSDNMKTHKNPGLRQGPKPFTQGPKPYKAPTAPKPVAPKVAPKTAPKKPPKFELEADKKWIVEYQEGNKNLVIENTSKKQTVYIYKCTNSVIQIKGKVNAITLDTCKKVGVVFESVMASLDIINSQSVQAQVQDKTPIVNIDKTDGAMVYLSENCKDAQIVTAKSSEMNILVPVEGGEFKEFAVPEQFLTVFDGKRLVTSTNESLG